MCASVGLRFATKAPKRGREFRAALKLTVVVWLTYSVGSVRTLLRVVPIAVARAVGPGR